MYGHPTRLKFIFLSYLLLSATTTETPLTSSSIAIGNNNTGIEWLFFSDAATNGITIGGPLLYKNNVGPMVNDGIVFWRRTSDDLVVPVLADTYTISESNTSILLSGSANLPSDNNNTFPIGTWVSLEITLPTYTIPVVLFSVSFTVNTSLPNNGGDSGWQLCVKYIHDGPSNTSWRVAGYPMAGNSTSVESTTKLDYFGWPGYWVYLANTSIVSFFTLDIHDEYANPNLWTSDTTFAFKSGDSNGYMVAPQFMLGGGNYEANEVYEANLQLLFADETALQNQDMIQSVTSIVPVLLQLNSYFVQPMPPIRSQADSLSCFINARRTTPMWRTTPNGNAYQLQDVANFIYLGTTPESSYFEYQIYLLTNDTFWRDRVFQQMTFWLGGVNTSNGAIHTAYSLPNGPYNSDDRGNNRGYKIDLNAHMARYALLVWELVYIHENTNQTSWYTAAAGAAKWIAEVAKLQSIDNIPGSSGFPQKLDWDTNLPTPSVVSGRTMNALPIFERLLGNTNSLTNYTNFTFLRIQAENYLQNSIEKSLYYSGQHPDLPYWDYEQDSVWEIIEYWLDQGTIYNSDNNVTRYVQAMDHALGNFYFALTMLCPKQLSWVDNPTQLAADEQEEYSQYSVYTYHNRKWLNLLRLGNLTANNLFNQLADRLWELNMFTQVTNSTNPDDFGGFHEAIADPWLQRNGGYNFMGTVYLNELALDLQLQNLLLGTIPTPNYTLCYI